jgi:hypothetical protein
MRLRRDLIIGRHIDSQNVVEGWCEVPSEASRSPVQAKGGESIERE